MNCPINWYQYESLYYFFVPLCVSFQHVYHVY